MRALRALLCLVVGAVTGLGAVVAHTDGQVGLALAVAATFAVAAALPAGWTGRLAYAAGWVVVVGRAAWPRPEGDYLIGSDGPGYTLLGTGLVLVAGCFLSLPGAGRPVADRGVQPPPT